MALSLGRQSLRSLKRRASTEVLKRCSGHVEYLINIRSSPRDSPRFNIVNELLLAVNTAGPENRRIMTTLISSLDPDPVPGHTSVCT